MRFFTTSSLLRGPLLTARDERFLSPLLRAITYTTTFQPPTKTDLQFAIMLIVPICSYTALAPREIGNNFQSWEGERGSTDDERNEKEIP